MAESAKEPVVELIREPLDRRWVLIVTQTSADVTTYLTVNISDDAAWGVNGPATASVGTQMAVAPPGVAWSPYA